MGRHEILTMRRVSVALLRRRRTAARERRKVAEATDMFHFPQRQAVERQQRTCSMLRSVCECWAYEIRWIPRVLKDINYHYYFQGMQSRTKYELYFNTSVPFCNDPFFINVVRFLPLNEAYLPSEEACTAGERAVRASLISWAAQGARTTCLNVGGGRPLGTLATRRWATITRNASVCETKKGNNESWISASSIIEPEWHPLQIIFERSDSVSILTDKSTCETLCWYWGAGGGTSSLNLRIALSWSRFLTTKRT